MATSDYKKTPLLARLWPKRLTLGFGVAVCTAVLITEVIFLIPAAHFWHKSNQVKAIESVRMAWYHSSDPAAFLTAQHKARIGERMIRDGLLLGGVVFDSAGQPVAVFGERPALDLNIARLAGVDVQESPTTSALDVHYAPEDTGLSHHIVVRLPAEPIEAATIEQLRNFGLSVLFIAGLTAILFIFASMLLVIRPLRAINKSLRMAVDDPDRADRYQVHLGRRDEIGQISKSLNMLLTSVSVVYQDELASLKHAIDGFGFGIVRFNREGLITSANPEALKQFKQPDFNSLRGMNPNCAQPLGARGTPPAPLLDVLGETSEPMLLNLHTETGFFTVMAFCSTLRDPNGDPKHRFVAIMDMDEILYDSRKALTTAEKARTALRVANREVQELRRLLESCLCLMEPPSTGIEAFQEKFLPDRILNGWYNEALRDGMVTGELEHGILPPLAGNRKAIRNVLRQAMLLVYAHTESDRPVLKVTGDKYAGGVVEFTIVDVTHDREDKLPSRRRKAVDPTLPHAALKSAIKRAEGKIVAVVTEGNAPRVTFTLKAAASGPSEAEASEPTVEGQELAESA